MVKNLLKALIGLLLVFVFHIPHLIYLALLVSYASVFNNHPTLTASPPEHLRRAKKILNRGRLSELLYAALELRFALERMAQRDLAFAQMASNRMLKESDPSKKLANLHRIEPDAAFAHEIYVVNKQTGERFKWGEYKPLDRGRVSTVQGRLGDLLHPKEGLSLGLWNHSWYLETRRFLNETADYLALIYKDNTPFFAFEGLEHIEMVKLQ